MGTPPGPQLRYGRIKARGLKNSMDFRFYDFDDFLKSEKQNLQQINNKNS